MEQVLKQYMNCDLKYEIASARQSNFDLAVIRLTSSEVVNKSKIDPKDVAKE
jgi:hypothetical protein